MNFKENETEQKLRGGYYTPEPVARFLVRWALAGGAHSVLEPSCGDGSFIAALHSELSSSARVKTKLLSFEGVEVVSGEADKARDQARSLKKVGVKATVDNSDFFLWITNGKASAMWDAIVGNPPYIRYQYFDKDQRDRAESIFGRANVPFTKRTNAWVPFLIAAVMHLAPGGRLAMVIPAEILHIQHANGLRLLMEQEMESVALISIRDMIFEGTLQGVILLLATKRRSRHFRPLSSAAQPMFDDSITHSDLTTRLEILDIVGVEHLAEIDVDKLFRRHTAKSFHGDWMKALLTEDELRLVEDIVTRPGVAPFASIADVDIGIVTGANDFFVVDDATQKRYELESISSPMLAKSDLIKGITYTLEDHRQNASEGRSVHFLSFPGRPLSDLPPLMAEYLRLGEQQKLHTRFKCRIRDPWYVVPYVWASELSLLKRCHRYPRVIWNVAAAHSTDTAYRIKMRMGYTQRAKDLTFSFLNTLTFLHAEMLGRHYGGGVLELVPSEIERLPIPLITVSQAHFEKADKMIRQGASLDDLVNFTDNLILKKHLKLTSNEVEMLRAAHKRLIARRMRAD